jgi:uncharacterized membrane protein YgcG
MTEPLGQFGRGRHVAVAIFAFIPAALAATGLIGSPRVERFTAKQITVTPGDEVDSLNIREVVDYDMARSHHHGYFRNVDNDFGVPKNVVSTSPDAPSNLDISDLGSQTRLRIGDPNRTVSGQHRYVLSYTLPSANLREKGLFLDVVGNDDLLKTDRLDVVVTGFTLKDPSCSTGAVGTVGGCTLEPTSNGYRVTINNLAAQTGVTISGQILLTQSTTNLSDVALPPAPTLKGPKPLSLGGTMAAINSGLAALLFVGFRLRGRNRVFAGGAADAAFGNPDGRTRGVPDSKMGSFATTEFTPPKGIEPWEGAVLLSETISIDSPRLWISGMVGAEAITATKTGSHLVLTAGPKFASVTAENQAMITQLLGPKGKVSTGSYSQRFSNAWGAIGNYQEERIKNSGWWRRKIRTATKSSIGGLIIVGIFAYIIFGLTGAAPGINTAFKAFRTSPQYVLAAGALLTFVVAKAAYKSMLPARTAKGSALTIQTESFRRFLHVSEAQHVEWAWNNGLFREYSGWAVALGEAEAWDSALKHANVPPDERYDSSPYLIHSQSSSFSSSYSAPSESSSSGSSSSPGSSSSGSSGGGGGGGSSGSW